MNIAGRDRLRRASVGIRPPSQQMPDDRSQAAAARIASQTSNVVYALDSTGKASAVSEPSRLSTGSGTCHGDLLEVTWSQNPKIRLRETQDTPVQVKGRSRVRVASHRSSHRATVNTAGSAPALSSSRARRSPSRAASREANPPRRTQCLPPGACSNSNEK
ncbi:hypothetical protein GCM10022205_44770 [Spinactinospora alkalitolerans]